MNAPPGEQAREAAFERIARDGTARPASRQLALEMPVALEFDGLGYAVLMATPADLDDLVTGFALAERLIDGAEEILEIDRHAVDHGIILRVTLVPDRHGRIADRVRHRASDSACGLCGIENIEQALRTLPRVLARSDADDAAIFLAAAALRDHQPLNRATGAVQAAALCDADGGILLVREDVGRHNAFDKLIGAMAQAGQGWSGGFALLSSRCSYELVEKAALSGCPLLATISAPTSLAVLRAAEAGVTLRVLVRSDAMLAAST